MAGVSGLSSPTGFEPMTTTRQRHAVTSVKPISGCFVWLMAVVMLCFGSLSARALTEYEVKAAFLFNFAKFVEWPPQAFPQASTALVFGIMGDDPFGPTLPEILDRETVKGRPIKIQHYRPGDDFAGCHLLFVSRSLAGQAKDILDHARSLGVLTVSEIEGFTAQGGMINFVMVDKSVRFDINAKAMESAGLKASSKLLAVAHAVQD
jgi:YfiR/HmsC-like